MNEMHDVMRPSKTDTMVNIPITFSRRSEGAVSAKTLFWVISTVTIFFIVLVVALLTSEKVWYFKYPVALLLIYGYTFFLRFFVFREGRLSDAYETMVKEDYKLTTNAFWNIYEVSKKPPYIVYYANGLKGVFVRFDKDVIVGKEDHMEYRHFEGLADMYNVAHTLRLSMVNIDYMDSVGNDPRMEKVHATAAKASNPDLKALLTSIYSNLDHEMALDYTSFDVYLFTTRDREEDLWYNVRQVIEYGLKANYKSYSLFNPEELRKMAQAVMNLETFSMNQAQREVISSTLNTRIRPIKVIKADGTEQIINKTRQELEDEQAKVKQRINATQNKTKDTKSKNNEELVDLFEATSALDEQWSVKEDDSRVERKSKKSKKSDSNDVFDDDGIF